MATYAFRGAIISHLQLLGLPVAEVGLGTPSQPPETDGVRMTLAGSFDSVEPKPSTSVSVVRRGLSEGPIRHSAPEHPEGVTRDGRRAVRPCG